MRKSGSYASALKRVWRPLDLGGRGWDGSRWRSRSQRQRDPENEVNQTAGAGEEDGEQPDDADERGIEIEVVGEAGADSANLFVAAGAHQTLGWSGIAAGGRCSLAGQLGAAVVTELGTFNDFLLAFRAKHGSPPQSDIPRHSNQGYAK